MVEIRHVTVQELRQREQELLALLQFLEEHSIEQVEDELDGVRFLLGKDNEIR